MNLLWRRDMIFYDAAPRWAEKAGAGERRRVCPDRYIFEGVQARINLGPVNQIEGAFVPDANNKIPFVAALFCFTRILRVILSQAMRVTGCVPPSLGTLL